MIGLALLASCGGDSAPQWVAPEWLGGVPVTEVAVDIGDGCVAPGPPIERIESDRLSRIVNARFVSPNSIAVADELEDAVLIFEGDSVRTLGGPGEGPKESGVLTRLDDTGRPSTAVHLRVDRGVPGSDAVAGSESIYVVTTDDLGLQRVSRHAWPVGGR